MYCKRCKQDSDHGWGECPTALTDRPRLRDRTPTAGVTGNTSGKGRGRSVDPGANSEAEYVTNVTKPVTVVTKQGEGGGSAVTVVTGYHCPGCRCKRYATKAEKQKAYRERKAKL